MQGDEAGEEGSGSGRNYDNDDTYDDEGSGEEGSGMETGNIELAFVLKAIKFIRADLKPSYYFPYVICARAELIIE